MLFRALRFAFPVLGLLGASVAPASADPSAVAFAAAAVRPFAGIVPSAFARRPHTPLEAVISVFGGLPDGNTPLAGLVADAHGNLYGTTESGGSNGNDGTVFEMSPPAPGQTAWTRTILYSFGSRASCAPQSYNCDGFNPKAGLIFDGAGNLYGTTEAGGMVGASNGDGVVFELSPPVGGGTPWTETVLHVFSGEPDGATPLAGLVMDASGALYGTTRDGGVGANGCGIGPIGTGVAFKLTPPLWTETIVHDFTGTGGDGACLDAGLIVNNQGALYGTTPAGGLARGIAFKLTPGRAGYRETIIHDFLVDGQANSPNAGLIHDGGGALYGTTTTEVFKLAPPPKGQTLWTETVLHVFSGSPDGSYCVSGLAIDTTGSALYGTTSSGGAGLNGGLGTVFELKPPSAGQTTWTESVLHAFAGGTDGEFPVAGLVAFGNVLYGTTENGGNGGPPGSSLGTVFAIKP